MLDSSMSGNPVCVRDIEEEAARRLPRAALGYYASGADQQETLKENRNAFKNWYVIPRMLKDVSVRDLSTTVLGHKVSLPIGISPTAMQRMAHPEGECAAVKAAASMNTVFIFSTIATSSIEEVNEAAPDCVKWFQLYIYKDRQVTLQLVRRAEASGFSALVLTVDAPYFGKRLADVKNKFTLPPHLRMANFQMGDDKANRVNKSEGGSGINEYVKSLFDQSLTWEDLLWLKNETDLPIVVKGVLSAEDARLSLEHGASAIMVSNHGARQVDGVPPTIEALPEVVKAVGNQCEVYFDGGVTQGTDVLKALALGARMVFLGRPILWGLAYNGGDGARLVLEILKQELDLNMALSGCCRIQDITARLLRRVESYSKL